MRTRTAVMVCLVVLGTLATTGAMAKYDPFVLDAKVDESLTTFEGDVSNAQDILSKASGVLVCPKIQNVGLGVGVESGKCALRMDGKTAEYYKVSSVSYGLTAGIQSYAQVMAFMNDEELAKFRSSKTGWEAGVDGAVAVANVGASGAIDTATLKDPVVVVAFSQKGLMADLSIEGTKYTKIGTAADYEGYGYPFHRFVATIDVSDRVQRGAQTVQATIDIDGWITEADRAAMGSVIREQGPTEARNALEAMPVIGEIRHGGKSLPIQWAGAVERPGDHNYRVILASSEPMGFAWEKKTEDNFTIIQMDVNLTEKAVGSGVLQMGAELDWSDADGVVIKQGGEIRPLKMTVSYKKID